jgi:hypothetical protein
MTNIYINRVIFLIIMSTSPKVFISHSSTDKHRFVTDFASRLQKDGVDVWYDKWELLPGDSLVDKIFSEGIDQSDVVIIVISENSINSHWVKEELNSAVIKKIEGKCRIIPIIIDNCSVPVCLKNSVYEKIENLNDYEESYQKVHASIFQRSIKPPVGKTPLYLESINLYLSELSNVDLWILETICKHALKSPYPSLVMTSQFHQEAIDSGLIEEQINESLEILTNRGYLQDALNEFNGISAVKIPSQLLEIYCQQCVPQYNDYVLSVASSIVNDKKIENTEISNSTGIPLGIVTHILNYWGDIGKIKITTSMSCVLVHPNKLSELKRMLS